MPSTSTKQEKAILLFGQYKHLVETRKWVLEKAGFRAVTVLCLSDLESTSRAESIELFLLCDSLSPEARSSALALIHSHWPEAHSLVLTPANVSAAIDPLENVFPATEGPRKLITAIRTLIAKGTASAA